MHTVKFVNASGHTIMTVERDGVAAIRAEFERIVHVEKGNAYVLVEDGTYEPIDTYDPSATVTLVHGQMQGG